MIGYEFGNGEFVETAIDCGPEEEPDWYKALAQAGWRKCASLPEYQNAELGEFYAEIFVNDRGAYLADLCINGTGVTLILCSTAPALLRLLRDWVYPLTGHAQLSIWTEKLTEAADCLFDEQHGLDCAVEVKARERRRAADLYARRKK